MENTFGIGNFKSLTIFLNYKCIIDIESLKEKEEMYIKPIPKEKKNIMLNRMKLVLIKVYNFIRFLLMGSFIRLLILFC